MQTVGLHCNRCHSFRAALSPTLEPHVICHFTLLSQWCILVVEFSGSCQRFAIRVLSHKVTLPTTVHFRGQTLDWQPVHFLFTPQQRTASDCRDEDYRDSWRALLQSSFLHAVAYFTSTYPKPQPSEPQQATLSTFSHPSHLLSVFDHSRSPMLTIPFLRTLPPPQ